MPLSTSTNQSGVVSRVKLQLPLELRDAFPILVFVEDSRMQLLLGAREGKTFPSQFGSSTWILQNPSRVRPWAYLPRPPLYYAWHLSVALTRTPYTVGLPIISKDAPLPRGFCLVVDDSKIHWWIHLQVHYSSRGQISPMGWEASRVEQLHQVNWFFCFLNGIDSCQWNMFSR